MGVLGQFVVDKEEYFLEIAKPVLDRARDPFFRIGKKISRMVNIEVVKQIALTITGVRRKKPSP